MVEDQDVLYSNEMTLNGVIKANGGDGGGWTTSSDFRAGGGGGSGGALRITACTVTTGLSASLQAKGGNGGTTPEGGKMIFSVHLFTIHPLLFTFSVSVTHSLCF
jgi:hypothetical protein